MTSRLQISILNLYGRRQLAVYYRIVVVCPRLAWSLKRYTWITGNSVIIPDVIPGIRIWTLAWFLQTVNNRLSSKHTVKAIIANGFPGDLNSSDVRIVFGIFGVISTIAMPFTPVLIFWIWSYYNTNWHVMIGRVQTFFAITFLDGVAAPAARFT